MNVKKRCPRLAALSSLRVTNWIESDQEAKFCTERSQLPDLNPCFPRTPPACPATPTLSLLPGPGVPGGRKEETEAVAAEVCCSSHQTPCAHAPPVPLLSCHSPKCPSLQQKRSVLGRAPVAATGCPKMELCVHGLSLPLTAGNDQRSKQTVWWLGENLGELRLWAGKTPPAILPSICFRISPKVSSWEEKNWNGNSTFQTYKKLSFLAPFTNPRLFN